MSPQAMRKIYLPAVLITVLLPGILYAQGTGRIEELRDQLSRSNDTKSRAFIYNQMAGAWWFNNPDSALYYGRMAEREARSIGYQAEISRAISTQARALLSLGDLPGALDLFRKAEQLAEALKDDRLRKDVMIDMAAAYYRMSSFGEALSLALQSKELAEQQQDTTGVIIATTMIGSIYTDLENFSAAAETLSGLMSYLEQVDLPEEKGYLLYNLGNVFLAEQDYDSAVAITKSAVEMARMVNDRYLTEAASLQLALAYLAQHNIPDAERTIINLTGSSVYAGFVENDTERLLVYQELAIAKSDYVEALRLGWLAKRLAKQRGFHVNAANVYRGLARVHERQHRTDSAFFYLKKFNDVKDSIRKANRFGEIVNWNFDYELKKRELQTKALTAQLELTQERERRQFLLLLVTIGFLVLAAAVIFFIVRLVRQKQQLNKLLLRQYAETETSMKEVRRLNREIMKLTSHIIHDLRSPLSSVSAAFFLLKDSTDLTRQHNALLAAEREINRCKVFVNSLLTTAKLGEWAVQPVEIDMAELVNEVASRFQRHMYEKSVRCVTETDCATPLFSDRLAVERILDNLISNAIKFSPSGSEIRLNVRASATGARLEVSDQGPGMSEQGKLLLSGNTPRISSLPRDGQESFGIGLTSVQTLVRVLRGTLTLASSPGTGSRFIIELPSLLQRDG